MERHIIQQTQQQLLKAIQELRDEVNEKLQVVQNTLKQHEELHRRQVQKQNEMMDEFRQDFKKLSDNIFVNVEPLRQTMGQSLNEQSGRSMETQNNHVKAHIYSPCKPNTIADQSAASVHELYDFSCYGDNFELREQHAVHGQDKQAGMEEYQEVNPEENYFMVNGDWNVVGRKGKPIQYNYADSGASAAENYDKQSTAATGDIASMVSQMMSQKVSISMQSIWQDNPKTLIPFGYENSEMRGRSRSRDVRRRNMHMISKSSAYMPEISEFCIPNLRTFQAAKKSFFMDKFSNNSRACKVRLRLLFNNRGCLEVHLLVSVGADGDTHKWPMVFTCKGYVYNQSSMTYTQLWTMESQECRMPEKNQEQALEAFVCLSTSRDPCKNVTYDLLRKKSYVADGDRLLLKWNLKKSL